jgi:hypothetical protein
LPSLYSCVISLHGTFLIQIRSCVDPIPTSLRQPHITVQYPDEWGVNMSSRRRPPVKIVMCPSCGAPNTAKVQACQACGTSLAAPIPARYPAQAGPVRANPPSYRSRLSYSDHLRHAQEHPHRKKRNKNWLMDWKIAAPLLLLAGIFGLHNDHRPLNDLFRMRRTR